MNVTSLDASVFSLCASCFVVRRGENKPSLLFSRLCAYTHHTIQNRWSQGLSTTLLGEECHMRCRLTCIACDILLPNYQEGNAYSSVVSFSSFERWRAAARKASAMAVVSPISPPGRLFRSGFSLARSRFSFFPS